MPFHGVFDYNDQREALAFWYDAFLPVVNKHAPQTEGWNSETATMVN